MSDSPSMNSEWPPLNDAVRAHLEECSKCQEALQTKPVGLGQQTMFCSDYWRIFALYAEREGQINNIVGHDEFGNQAPRAADPDRPYYPI